MKSSKRIRAGLVANIETISEESEDAAALRAISNLGVLQNNVFANMTETTDVYLEFVRSTLGVRNVILTTLDFRYQHIINACNRDGCDIPIGSIIPTEATFCQYVRAKGAPVAITDATQDVRVMGLATQAEFSVRSYLGVPLIFSTGVIYGTLCALDSQPHEFSSTHIALMSIVARHIALLLECTSPRLITQEPFSESKQTSEPSDTQSAIFTMVIHDLRNPLNGLQGYIELFLCDILGSITDEQRDVLTRMARSTQLINRLATDLVDVAAAQNGTLSLLTEEFDPFDIGQSVLEMFHDEAIDRELTLRIDGLANVPLMVGDQDRVHQILSNLVGNALRHTPTGEVLLFITGQDDTVLFEVKDTGPGIAKDAQAAIWQKHTRLTTEGRGLGLGLHIVQHLVQAMNGTFGVDSTPGHGSRFWVRLPIHTARPSKMKFHSA